MYSRALLASVLVHVALVVWLSTLEPTATVAPRAPVELDLVFKQPVGRRAPVPPPPLGAPRPPPRRHGASPGGGAPPVAIAAPALTAAAAPEPRVPAIISARSSFGAAGFPGADGGGGDGHDGRDQRGDPGAPFDAEPTLERLPRIEYPEAARLDEVEGLVRLEVELDAEGQVLSVHVLEAPDSSLAEAARQALSRAHFRPALRGGRPTPTRFEYRYRFELR